MYNRKMASLAPLACVVLFLRLSAAVFATERGCPTFTGNWTLGAPPLPLPFDGYLPAIDNETMFLHYTRHAGGAITTVNNILARYPTLQRIPLAELVQKIGMPTFISKNKLLANDTIALRNNAGSAYNHAIFWRIMTSYNSSSPSAALSAELARKINATWGSPIGMLDSLRAAGASVFGSGWAWLVYRDDGSLRIVTTPNQDNPVMLKNVPADRNGVPLIGVDVWEHAYYLKYRNVRTSYLAQWVYLVDWAALQRNYDLAKQGLIDSIYC